jgi:hypothetical protein
LTVLASAAGIHAQFPRHPHPTCPSATFSPGRRSLRCAPRCRATFHPPRRSPGTPPFRLSADFQGNVSVFLGRRIGARARGSWQRPSSDLVPRPPSPQLACKSQRLVPRADSPLRTGGSEKRKDRGPWRAGPRYELKKHLSLAPRRRDAEGLESTQELWYAARGVGVRWFFSLPRT